MRDLFDLLYSEQDLELLRGLLGSHVLGIETEEHLFTNVICKSGRNVYAMPEEVWVSRENYDAVGYSWVKRAAISDKPWSNHEENIQMLQNICGVIDEICIVRSAVIFSEVFPERDKPHDTGIEKVDALLDELDNKFTSRDFDWQMVNPDLIESCKNNLRHSLVDIGFILKIGKSIISIAAYENFFSLNPAIFPRENLNEHFFQQHKCLTIS